MAAHGALPRKLAEIHPRFLTPTWSTWAMGLASIAWYAVLVFVDSSENILWDSISGLGFAIAFYYGITALASPILFRKVLTKSWKHFVLAGVLAGPERAEPVVRVRPLGDRLLESRRTPTRRRGSRSATSRASALRW